MKSVLDREMMIETPCGRRTLVRGDGQVTLDLGRLGARPGPGIGRVRPCPIAGFAWLAKPPRRGTLRARTLPNAVALLVRGYLRERGAS